MSERERDGVEERETDRGEGGRKRERGGVKERETDTGEGGQKERERWV